MTYSKNFKEGISSLERGASFLFIPALFALAGQFITEKVKRSIFQSFAITVLLMCIVSYLRSAIMFGQYIPSSQDEAYTYHDPLSRYAFSSFLGFHPTYLSLYLLIVLIIVFERCNIAIIFKIMGLVLIVFFQVILSSKNQLLILLPLAGILLWRHINVSIWIKSAIVSLVLIVLVYFAIQNEQIKYRFNNEMGSGVNQRTILWTAGKKIIGENIFMGVGIGDSQDVVDAAMIDLNHPEMVDFNLHNQYLQYALAFGIVGLAIFVLILILPFVRTTDWMFFLFILVIASSSVTESILMRQKGLYLFLIFYGLLGLNYDFTRRPQKGLIT
jgi:O-antigen ligase